MGLSKGMVALVLWVSGGGLGLGVSKGMVALVLWVSVRVWESQSMHQGQGIGPS